MGALGGKLATGVRGVAGGVRGVAGLTAGGAGFAMDGLGLRPKPLHLKVVRRFVPAKGSFAARRKQLKKEVRAEIEEAAEELEKSVTSQGAANSAGKTLVGGAVGGAVDTVANLTHSRAPTPVQTASEARRPDPRGDARAEGAPRGDALAAPGALALSLALALVPWTLVLRLAGLAVLGPHMHFVGKKLQARADEAADLEKRWAAADREARREMEAEAKAKIYAKEKAKLEKLQTKLRQRSRKSIERDALLAAAKYNLIVPADRAASNVKYHATALRDRSKAYATPAFW